MAFPSDIGTKQDDLTRAWRSARSWAGGVKQRAQTLSDQSAAGIATSSQILEFATFLAEAKVQLTIARNVPGIGAYAKSQVDDPALDIAAEFTAMVTALDNTTAWVVANFPKDGNGWLLAQTMLTTGRTTDRVFSAAGTATLRTVLDALIATIN